MNRFQCLAPMLYEPTTLATVARLIGETLEGDYSIDPAPILGKATIDTTKFYRPGARVNFSKMRTLWAAAVEVTGDPYFGFKVGERVKPADFFVLGHAWLASATLAGALKRVRRHAKVVSTVHRKLKLEKRGDEYALVESWPDKSNLPPAGARDASYVATLRLFDAVSEKHVRPTQMSLTVSADRKSVIYDELFGCPVEYGCDEDIWMFRASELDQPLTGSIPEVLKATDRIAKKYVDSLEDNTVATSVRQLLVQMLPSGNADQEEIAKRLYRSTSTLQRQLSSEGTNYRAVLETTRKELAEQYLRDEDYSQAQIAFMVGFADQSNFARAFKRWTGMSPGEYRAAA